MLDLLNRHIIYTLDVGGTPHFVITGLYPLPVDTTPPPKRPAQQASMQVSVTKIVGYALLMVSFVSLLLLILLLLRLRSS